jgi:hypothetical protein
MKFKQWLENSQRTGSKLGLYPSIEDALGQYPPLYGTPKAADLITYIDIMYGINNIPGKNGIIRYKDEHPHKAFGIRSK